MDRTSLMSLLVIAGLVLTCEKPTSIVLTKEQKELVRQHLLSKPPERMTFRLDANLGRKIVLLGMDLDKREASWDEEVTVTWYWKCLQPLGGDWRIFVHFDLAFRQNLDHEPIDGLHPMKSWKKGQIIKDVKKFKLDRRLGEGEAVFWTGVYRGGERLQLTNAGQVPNDGKDRIRAATLRVRAPGKYRRSITVKPLTSPIQLDGKLDEAGWHSAVTTKPFVDPVTGRRASVGVTRAQLAYDRTHLYVGFECRDRNIWSTIKTPDHNTWLEDVVEVFIDANGDQRDYVELHVTPAGVPFDARFTSHRKPPPKDAAAAYTSGMQFAVDLQGTLNNKQDRDKRWTVEMKIPFGSLPDIPSVPPKPGDTFRVNLFRADKLSGDRNAFAAWSPPLGGDFHNLGRFGTVVFSGTPTRLSTTRPASQPSSQPTTQPAKP